MCVRQIIFIFYLWILTPHTFTPRRFLSPFPSSISLALSLLLYLFRSLWWCPRAATENILCMCNRRSEREMCGNWKNSRYNFTHVLCIIHTYLMPFFIKDFFLPASCRIRKWKMFVQFFSFCEEFSIFLCKTTFLFKENFLSRIFG